MTTPTHKLALARRPTPLGLDDPHDHSAASRAPWVGLGDGNDVTDALGRRVPTALRRQWAPAKPGAFGASHRRAGHRHKDHRAGETDAIFAKLGVVR